MRGTLFTLMCVMCSIASATTVYKWVDADGIVHYSDQPHENASKVDLQGAQTYSPPAPAAPDNTTRAQTNPGSDAGTAPQCSLVQPTPEQAFLNAFSVTVIVKMTPAEPRGSTVALTLDGKPLAGVGGPGTEFTITPIDRGQHSVQASIRNADGQMLCQTPNVTFYVRQPSLLSPQHRRH